ncbi:hypothetical protein EV649_7641 [Kribbella sp. VKM Ac-2569]|nr:hypothetical protein EV649_7641 [Kribbella sp. VKM Ac-2569]
MAMLRRDSVPGGEAEGWVVGVGGEAGGDVLDFGLGLRPGGRFQGAQGVNGSIQAGAEPWGLGVACVLRRLQACDAEGPNGRKVVVRKHAGSLAQILVRHQRVDVSASTSDVSSAMAREHKPSLNF